MAIPMRKNPSEILQELRKKAELVDDTWVLRLDDAGGFSSSMFKKRNKSRPCVVCVARRTMSESSDIGPPHSVDCASAPECSSSIRDEREIIGTLILELNSKTRRILNCEISGKLIEFVKQSDTVSKTIDEICKKGERTVLNTLIESVAQCSAAITFTINGQTFPTEAKSIHLTSKEDGLPDVRLECSVIGTNLISLNAAKSVPPMSLSATHSPTPNKVSFKAAHNDANQTKAPPTPNTPVQSDVLSKLCDGLFLDDNFDQPMLSPNQSNLIRDQGSQNQQSSQPMEETKNTGKTGRRGRMKSTPNMKIENSFSEMPTLTASNNDSTNSFVPNYSHTGEQSDTLLRSLLLNKSTSHQTIYLPMQNDPSQPKFAPDGANHLQPRTVPSSPAVMYKAPSFSFIEANPQTQVKHFISGSLPNSSNTMLLQKDPNSESDSSSIFPKYVTPALAPAQKQKRGSRKKK
ncbi:hypothetical protein DdX_05883 [Ditylenchus destructor]|uniref:Uncharacterized protein n=1 Tax=Ditylenchus destructor TaxID=166010 RepID=A0AAD4N895_9BILA|nr:hypothetical protein DdX_05883 [Ditylenchus destructor]